jgi:radical SAM protein with 4Fe4S-binding SPASM domain
VSFDLAPVVVIWETTQACALKCVHCRAEAIDRRSDEELTTDQAFSLLEEIRRFGDPLVVLTGGDPLRRPDAVDIVEYGTVLGLHMAMTPSATPEVSLSLLKELKKAGLKRLAVSLDGPTAEIHDAFRGVAGSYDWTLKIMRWANEIGLSLQINTTVSRHNLQDFDAIAAFLEKFKVDLWSVFFLVPVGRATLSQEPGAREFEKIFERMSELSHTSSFQIKSTEAPQYRRVLIQTNRQSPRPILPISDGKGFVFISHTGEVYPSGFLPVFAGNVKKDPLVDLYQNSELFRTLRDASKLKGKCGACEYKSICGGSRARAYAIHRDVMASDPYCVHVPKGYEVSVKEESYW